MAAKRKVRPRAIPTYPERGALREAATEGDDYVLDVDGPRGADGVTEPSTAHWIILNQRAREVVERCPVWVSRPEAEDRVATLNRTEGEPSREDNQSWGILTRKRARPDQRVTDKAVKLRGGLMMPSPTACVERMVASRSVSVVLAGYRKTGRGLNRGKTLPALLERVVEAKTWAAFQRYPRFDKFIDAVSRQLFLKYGVSRANPRD